MGGPGVLTHTTLSPLTKKFGADRNNVQVLPFSSVKQQLAAGGRIPAIKASAAFFTSLRANLRLTENSPQPSPASTPTPFHTSKLYQTSVDNASVPDLSLPPPTSVTSAPSTAAKPTLPPLAIPARPSLPRQLSTPQIVTSPAFTNTTTTATSAWDIVQVYDKSSTLSALQLLCTTVIEQRYVAFRSLMTHPVNVVLYVLVQLLLFESMYFATQDFLWLSMASAGVTLIFLAVFWAATWGYTGLAAGLLQVQEGNGIFNWLGDDDIFVAVSSASPSDQACEKPKQQIAGVLVLSWSHTEGSLGSCRNNQRFRRKKARALIRAWAVRHDLRGQGIGTALLREAARMMRSRSGEGLWFDAANIFSEPVLVNFYNGSFRRRDRWACQKLATVMEGYGQPNTLIRKR